MKDYTEFWQAAVLAAFHNPNVKNADQAMAWADHAVSVMKSVKF